MNTITTNKLASSVILSMDNNKIKQIKDNLIAIALDPTHPQCIDAIRTILALIEKTEDEVMTRELWDFIGGD